MEVQKARVLHVVSTFIQTTMQVFIVSDNYNLESRKLVGKLEIRKLLE